MAGAGDAPRGACTSGDLPLFQLGRKRSEDDISTQPMSADDKFKTPPRKHKCLDPSPLELLMAAFPGEDPADLAAFDHAVDEELEELAATTPTWHCNRCDRPSAVCGGWCLGRLGTAAPRARPASGASAASGRSNVGESAIQPSVVTKARRVRRRLNRAAEDRSTGNGSPVTEQPAGGDGGQHRRRSSDASGAAISDAIVPSDTSGTVGAVVSAGEARHTGGGGGGSGGGGGHGPGPRGPGRAPGIGYWRNAGRETLRNCKFNTEPSRRRSKATLETVETTTRSAREWVPGSRNDKPMYEVTTFIKRVELYQADRTTGRYDPFVVDYVFPNQSNQRNARHR